MHEPDPLDGYAAEAATLIPRYTSVSSAEKLRHVAHLIPASPARIADIGAGTGGDAAWLCALGHSVLAVEPTAGLREAGQRQHAGARIEWLDDRLPLLQATRARGERFALVLLCGVWAHLPPATRAEAMINIERLLAPGGTVILSLRHGPAPATRPTWPAPAQEVLALARPCGLKGVLQVAAESLQAANRAAGITWTWLALCRESA